MGILGEINNYMDNNIPKAVKVYKKEPSQDGICIDLDNDTTVEISDTEWKTEGNIRKLNGLVIFQLRTGLEISLTEEQASSI
jgi:hypothetical protein